MVVGTETINSCPEPLVLTSPAFVDFVLPVFDNSLLLRRHHRLRQYAHVHTYLGDPSYLNSYLYAGGDGLAGLVAPVDDASAVVRSLEAQRQAAIGISVERHLSSYAGGDVGGLRRYEGAIHA